jgi:hypothetical protein
MKKIFLYIVIFALGVIVAQGKDDIPGYDYELSLSEDNVSATSGFKVFKVWSYGKKKQLLTEEIGMRNAIHGIIFKGIAASDIGSQGNVPPLVPEGYESHKEYFDAFFNSGEYKQFVQLTSRGAIQAGDVMKLSSNRYKVGMLVQVNLNALRKRLEKDGIVQNARNIFNR